MDKLGGTYIVNLYHCYATSHPIYLHTVWSQPQTMSRTPPPVAASNVTAKSKSSSTTGAGSKPVHCGTRASGCLMLGRVLIDGCYSTHFSFVIFHCTLTLTLIRRSLGGHFDGSQLGPLLGGDPGLRVPYAHPTFKGL